MDYPKLRPIDAVPVDGGGRRMIALQDPQGFCTDTLMVNTRTYYLLTFFDGTHTIPEIQVAYNRKFGELMFSDRIRELIADLDSRHLLFSENFEKYKKEVAEEFKKQSVIRNRHCGTSYPDDPEELAGEIDGYFNDLPEAEEGRDIRALIAPHIDFRRGGGTYGQVYRYLKGRQDIRLIIVFGTSHNVMKNRFTVTDKNYQTPFGTIGAHGELAASLRSAFPADLEDDVYLFQTEHSIDFQMVFLSFLFRDRLDSIKVLPVLCGSFDSLMEQEPERDEDIERMVSLLKEKMKEPGVLAVAGADLAHVGMKFGDPCAPSPSSLAALAEQDRAMLACVEKGDAGEFYRNVVEEGDRRRICGLAPVYMTLRVLGKSCGKLLDYRQCIDPAGHSVVTIAGMTMS